MTTPTVDYVAKNEKLLMHKHKFTDMKGQLDLATQVTGVLTVANGGTGLTTFSAGQVLFGPLLQSSNLYWDNPNVRLGIGTSSPSAKNHIVMNGIAGEGAILITGKALDASTDTNGIGFYLTHNAAGNRQWSICDSLSGMGVRFLGASIDGFKYSDSSRQNLIIGTNTTGVGFGGQYREGAVSIDATAAIKNLVLRLAASPSVNCLEVQNSAGTPKLAFGNQVTTDCLIKWPNIVITTERVGLDFFCPGAYGARIGINSANGDFIYQDTSGGPAGVTRFTIARATGALGISGTSLTLGATAATSFSIISNTYNGSTYIDSLIFKTYDNGSGQPGRLIITAGGTIANAVATARFDKTQVLISSDRAQDVVPFTTRASSGQTSDIVNLQDSANANLYIFDKKGRPRSAGTTPTIAAGAGAGTTPTVSVAGTDVNGVITVLTGTAPSVSAIVATITYSTGYAAAPKIVTLTPANTATAALNGTACVFIDSAGLSTTKFDITVGSTALAATTTYKWYYEVLG